jgi:hypothetical protein
MSQPDSSRSRDTVVRSFRSGASRAGRRRGALLALLGVLVVVTAGLTVIWFVTAPAGGPHAPLPSASLVCVAEPGTPQRDIDPDDSPEHAWKHVPGGEVTVYFATAGVPRRYAEMVATGARLWSLSPCIEALAVDSCPAGTNCTTIRIKERGNDRDTDGATSSDDRDGVRLASRITLYTALLDKESDNGALATVVHEMGHALGLVHRKQPGTVMNAMTDDHTDPTPDETDYANLQATYG